MSAISDWIQQQIDKLNNRVEYKLQSGDNIIPIFSKNITFEKNSLGSVFSQIKAIDFGTANVTFDSGVKFNNTGCGSSVSALTNGVLVSDTSTFNTLCRNNSNLSIFSMNTSAVTNMNYAFCGCSELVKFEPNTNAFYNSVSANYAFYRCSMLTSFTPYNAPNLVTSCQMFWGDTDLTSCQLHTPLLQNAKQMFYNCQNIADVRMGTCSALTDANQMFYQCYMLDNMFTTHLKATAITDATQMFTQCHSLTTVAQNEWTKVSSALSMFQNCYSLTGISMGNMPLLTSGVSMFYSCSSLTSASISAENLVNGTSMFRGCSSLSSITTIGNCDSLTNGSYMFAGCSSITSVPFNKDHLTGLTTAQYMFCGCTNLSSFSFGTGGVSVTGNELKLSGSMDYMFYNCSSIVTIAYIDATNVTSMSHTFDGCSGIGACVIYNLSCSADFADFVSGNSYWFYWTIPTIKDYSTGSTHPTIIFPTSLVGTTMESYVQNICTNKGWTCQFGR